MNNPMYLSSISLISSISKATLLFVLVLISLNTQALNPGDAAPVIALQTLDGEAASQQRLSVSDFKGKLIYVDFWASWCGPCRQSLPILNKIRNRYNDKGFEVLAINVDEKLKDAVGFLKKYPVDYPILLDPGGNSPRAYNVRGMPTAYLINENGKVIYKHQGFKKKDGKKIEKLVSDYLANK
ncbi:MAG: TlpA disulfide reductase family protein [Pseudomonadota bacterium]